MSEIVWLIVGVTLLLLALGLYLWGRGTQRLSGLGMPAGSIVYRDRRAWRQPAQTLTHPGLRLAGRPDYVVKQRDGSLIPLELKSRPAPAQPHPGHVMQLMAYCALVEATYGRRPACGILHYSDRAFLIRYTPAREAKLAELIGWMQHDAAEADIPRSHNSVARCRACAVRNHCADRLA